MDKFWFVWNPHGLVPNHKHESLKEAEKEAERLDSSIQEKDNPRV